MVFGREGPERNPDPPGPSATIVWDLARRGGKKLVVSGSRIRCTRARDSVAGAGAGGSGGRRRRQAVAGRERGLLLVLRLDAREPRGDGLVLPRVLELRLICAFTSASVFVLSLVGSAIALMTW